MGSADANDSESLPACRVAASGSAGAEGARPGHGARGLAGRRGSFRRGGVGAGASVSGGGAASILGGEPYGGDTYGSGEAGSAAVSRPPGTGPLQLACGGAVSHLRSTEASSTLMDRSRGSGAGVPLMPAGRRPRWVRSRGSGADAPLKARFSCLLRRRVVLGLGASGAVPGGDEPSLLARLAGGSRRRHRRPAQLRKLLELKDEGVKCPNPAIRACSSQSSSFTIRANRSGSTSRLGFEGEARRMHRRVRDRLGFEGEYECHS